MKDRLGVTLGLGSGSLAQEIELCETVLQDGYTDVWTAEVGGSDGFVPLAVLARTSPGVRLGTGIVPVSTRPPALLAMSAASLQNLSGGRFVLGLGTSSDIIVRNWMGQSFDRPITRLRETVEVLRALLAGEKVSFEGHSFGLSDYRLQIDPTSRIPIYLAALGPKACRLAGEVADGVIFFLKTPEAVREGLEWVAQGARGAGRDPADLDCVLRVTVAVDEDLGSLRPLERRLMTTYAMVDVYNRSLSQQGFEQEAQAIVSAWKAGDRVAASAAVSDRMIESLNITGDAETARAKLQRFQEAGVKTPVMLPLSVAADPQERATRVVSTLRAVAG